MVYHSYYQFCQLFRLIIIIPGAKWNVNVYAGGAGSFYAGLRTNRIQQFFHYLCSFNDLVKTIFLIWVQVNEAPVGVLPGLCTGMPGMEFNTPQVGHINQRGFTAA